jgi:hypothetical protein
MAVLIKDCLKSITCWRASNTVATGTLVRTIQHEVTDFLHAKAGLLFACTPVATVTSEVSFEKPSSSHNIH